MLRDGQIAEPVCARRACEVAPTMHPELGVWVDMLFFVGSDFWAGERWKVLGEIGACWKDRETLANLYALYLRVNREARESESGAGIDPRAIAARAARAR